MVSVEATPFAFRQVLLGGKLAWPRAVVVTPPYRFAIQIPPDTASGTDTLEAIGVIENLKVIESPSLTIDVERPDSPRSLKTVFSTLQFYQVGKDIRLLVEGIFEDGTTIDLTRSRYTSYESASPAVALIGADGLVTAKGPGSTVIKIQHRDQSITVKVIVKDHEIPKQN
jgi:hypothetical protein